MKKPRNRIKEVIIVSIVFLVFILAMEFVVGQRLNKMTVQVKSDFEAKQSKLQASEELVRKLPDPQKAIEDIEKKAEEFKTTEINKRQIPRIIQLLGRSVEERKISIVSIRARDDIKTEQESLPTGISKLYIEMVMNCSYKQLGDYFASLNKLSVVFIIEDVALAKRTEANKMAPVSKEALEKSGDKNSELVATVLLSTYMVWEM
jgi:Tfp pilus assembly protein PilO